MKSRLRAVVIASAVLFLGIAAPLAVPEPPKAEANVICDPPVPDPGDAIGAIGGAFGIGDPIGDACEAVTDPVLGIPAKALDPLKNAASSIGKGVFNQVTSWVADGAVWLIGEVATLSEKTTTPNLLSKGFLRQYKLMVAIAGFMAAMMVILAVFEALGRGDPGLLWRVFFVNVPLAAIATSAAYVVVQLLIVTCDGMCMAISHSGGADSKEFFKGAIGALAKAGASPGALNESVLGGGPPRAANESAGAIAVPLFVGFIAAIVAAFAAFFVWIELLMRDAAIYVVALFMPLAIAASIWPRWVSALRRTCELVLVIIFSKFVIVAIVSLAASLLARNDGAVEHLLAAGAMLLLACFSPLVLFRLVPFAEGAAGAAFSRQGAGSAAIRTVQSGNSVSMMQRMSRANWTALGLGEGGGKSGGGSGGGGRSGTKGSSRSPRGGGSGGATATGEAGIVPVAAVLDKAAHSGQHASERLSETGVAKTANGVGGGGGPGQGGGTGGEVAGSPPSSPTSSQSGKAGGPGASKPPSARPQPQAPAEEARAGTPSQASGGEVEPGESRPPRPSADTAPAPPPDQSGENR